MSTTDKPMSAQAANYHHDKANDIVRKYALLATGAGFIPIPFMDVLATGGLQYKMLQEMCDLYNVEFDAQQGRAATAAAATAVLGWIVAEGLEMMSDSNGAMAGFTGGLARAALSGFITAESGEIYRLHFENGGTLETLSLSNYTEYVNKQIETGEFSPSRFANPTQRFGYLFR